MKSLRPTRWWFALTVAAAIASGVCYARHVCMDGHMRHPPYSWLGHALDVFWLLATGTIAVTAWALRAPGRTAIALIVLAAAAARFGIPRVLAGVLMLLEPLLWFALLALSWRSFGRRFPGGARP